MERLFIKGNQYIHCHTLKLQFRMRSDLARFIRLFYREYQTSLLHTQFNEKLHFIPHSFFWVSNQSHQEEMNYETLSYVNIEQAKVKG